VDDELVALIAKQVDDHGIVVWYDPETVYSEVAEGLSLPQTTVLRYADGFLELRRRIDPLLEFVEEDGRLRADAEVPPRLVVCVPRDRVESHHALVEVEAAGVVMEPGANPWQRNTRRKVLAERVFTMASRDRRGIRADLGSRRENSPPVAEPSESRSDSSAMPPRGCSLMAAFARGALALWPAAGRASRRVLG
jgi:hypothetical protein